MKKSFVLLLCLFVCLPLFASCAAPEKKSAGKAVEAFFAAASSFDSEKETALLSLSEEEKDWYFHGLSDAEFEAYEEMTLLSESFGVLFCEIVGRTEYKIEKITLLSEQSAEARVCVTYVNGEALFATVLADVQRELIGQSLNEKNITFEKACEIAVAAMIRDRSYPFVTEEVLVELALENGVWKIVPNEAASLVSNCRFCRDSEEILSLIGQIR